MAFLDAVRADNANEPRLPQNRGEPASAESRSEAPVTATGVTASSAGGETQAEPKFDSYRVKFSTGNRQFTEVLDTTTGDVIQRIPYFETGETAETEQGGFTA